MNRHFVPYLRVALGLVQIGGLITSPSDFKFIAMIGHVTAIGQPQEGKIESFD